MSDGLGKLEEVVQDELRCQRGDREVEPFRRRAGKPIRTLARTEATPPASKENPPQPALPCDAGGVGAYAEQPGLRKVDLSAEAGQ